MIPSPLVYHCSSLPLRFQWPDHDMTPRALSRLEIAILLFFACLSIAAMSFGIDFTRQLFGVVANVMYIERDYGPIWPFSVSVVSFFVAAVCIWTNIVVQGSYDFLLDKAYFAAEGSPIEMEKTLPRHE
ncbi:unnamed protein product [Caenorhabditis auriculariae]|uniref:Uncharacterized protein n=1 Tax=Caenorhabditis auriculariae TaxID=2777116 RepID=A0A8S1HIL9_9PELO|nr:unnamed protein product [Caenorhabditis auriculariae]